MQRGRACWHEDPMSKLALAAAALLAVSASALTHAAPMSGGEIRARSAGGEFRGFGSTPRSPLEDMIWRFRPDGSVASISTIRRRSPLGSQSEEYRDAGNWRVEGNRLCVEFGASHRHLSGCYGVDATGGDHVRLVGPVLLEGTLSR
jgi:hypothetical protein